MDTTSIEHKEQRVGVFVDVQNLYHSAKHLYRGRVNYRELIRHIVNGRKVVRMMAYVVKSDNIIGNEEGAPRAPRAPRVTPESETRTPEVAFFEALQEAGLELRLKDLQIYPDGSKKADWDVGLAIDAVRMANIVDVIILVTGDGDFVPLVEYLKWGLGRQVEVAAFGRSTSSKLKDAADKFVNIENVPKIIMKSHK